MQIDEDKPDPRIYPFLHPSAGTAVNELFDAISYPEEG